MKKMIEICAHSCSKDNQKSDQVMNLNETQKSPPLFQTHISLIGHRINSLKLTLYLAVILASLWVPNLNEWTLSTAEAKGQLSDPKVIEPNLEQKVDAIFGDIVSAMASVLLWDIAMWDNDANVQRRSDISSGTPLTDPLGWGVFSVNQQEINFHDFDGTVQASYRHEGLSIDRAWIINDGRELLIRSKQGQIYIFPRRLKGASEALGPYLLPDGEWTAFADLGGQKIFGSSSGRLYRLERERGSAISKSSWSEPQFLLGEAIIHLSQRSDGAYWLIVGQEGKTSVITPLAPALPNQIFKADEQVSFSRPTSLNGELISAGFSKDQLWVALTDGLYTWNSREGTHGFAIQLPEVSSIHPLEMASADGAHKQYYIIASKTDAPHAISSEGEEINLKLPKNHPLMMQGTSLHSVSGQLWASAKGEHAVRLSIDPTQGLSLAGETMTKEGRGQLIALIKSGSHLISHRVGGIDLWYKYDFKLPLIVLWLVFGAVFFTLRMRFVNLRFFRHAIEVVKGKYTDPNSVGEVSHFQALTSALSATVGLGNIAGVAIAVSLGGPGATFWMIVAGFLGMASKFTECTLGQKYRTVSAQGEVMGGAMHYLSRGLQAERGLPKLGKALAVLFSFLCIGGSFGGGNAFQVKQSLEAVAEVIPALNQANWIYGLLMAAAVGVVILGGIKSIAQTAEKIVPAMCGLYILASLYVILLNVELVPQAMSEIIGGAFSPDALYGGAVGVLVVGFKRAAFSNEAGIGSAAIAHAAAKTEYPVREGIVALLEPFIDTIVVCSMTALVIVITGAYHNPEYGSLVVGNKGAALTSQAMGEAISFFPYILSVAVILFAYSTMISWSYYGERCWAWLFGENAALFSMGRHASLIYRVLFLIFAFLGSIVTATNILDFSDLMILGMALPNIFGILLLSKGVSADLDTYEEKLKAGEFPIFEQQNLEQEALNEQNTQEENLED